MTDNVEMSRRMRAIRRLATTFPAQGMEDRLEKIRGLALGELTPDVARMPTSNTFFERIRAGTASRAVRTAADKTEEALVRKRQKDAAAEAEAQNKRKSRSGRDRMERSGLDRSSDSA